MTDEELAGRLATIEAKLDQALGLLPDQEERLRIVEQRLVLGNQMFELLEKDTALLKKRDVMAGLLAIVLSGILATILQFAGKGIP